MALSASVVAGLDGPLVVGGVVVLAAAASLLLAILGVLAFKRRRTVSYCFVAGALVILAGKALIGAAALAGVLSYSPHHIIEHGLDFVMAIFLILAIYTARSGAHADLSGRLFP